MIVSNAHPTVCFRTVLSTLSGNSSESPYYPLGSEASIRPFSPKFIIEEISSNYEPVLVSNRELAVTPVIGISPMLPKRLARMELDVINNKKPFIEVTPPKGTFTPQCGTFKIFLSLRFSVESIFDNLKGLKLSFLPFLGC